MPHVSSQRKDGVLVVQLTFERIPDDALILQIERRIRMCHLPSTVIEVLDKTRLKSSFKIFDSVEEALSDLRSCTDVHGA